MSFLTMYSELRGSVPKIPTDLCKTLVNRSWADIRRRNLWSFQLFEANWISPALVNAGTVATTQGTNTVVFNGAAAAVLNPLATTGPFPTNLLQRQFRIGASSTIYNIWAWDGVNTATLDRPYVESSAAASKYTVYQCYYPAPMKDWLTWMTIRDMTNYNDLRTETTRAQLDARDPQRSIFYLPTDCAPYQLDQNPASATYGFQLFELWGQPLYVLPYQLYGIRRGTDLVNDSDILPNAVGEDAVMEGAKMKAYEWAEANKADIPRNAGANFQFLMGAAKAEFERLIKGYRKDDRERVDSWFSVRRPSALLPNAEGYFNAIANRASPGAPW